MNWHPVNSVQQQTPDNEGLLSFQHFKSTFCILGIFSKTGKKLGSHTGSKWWPGDPDVKDDPNDPLTRWPNDPVPCVVYTCASSWLMISIWTRSCAMLRSLGRWTSSKCLHTRPLSTVSIQLHWLDYAWLYDGVVATLVRVSTKLLNVGPG